MDFLVNPLKVVGKAGKVSAIHCIKTELADFDDSGRRRPVPVEGSEYTIRASSVIYCLGQKLSLGLTGGKLDLDQPRPHRRRPAHHGHQHRPASSPAATPSTPRP